MEMISAFSETFLSEIRSWFESEPEVLLLVRYSRAAGSKSFEFFTSFEVLTKRIRELPPETHVIVFRQHQLALRGTVDEAFIHKCLATIPDGSEYVVAETVRSMAGSQAWFHHDDGISHAELRESLEESRGRPVAVGEYPPWLEASTNVISAIVPHADGSIKRGIY